MRRKTSLVMAGVVLSILLLLSLAGTQPGYAHMSSDCDLYAAFLDADAEYTSTFRSWYFGDPTSCAQECANAVDFNACVSSCDTSRSNAFLSAQDALMDAVSQSCPFNPDECAAARARRDQCVATRYSYLQNPVLDENGNVDSTWRNFVIDEYWACWSASGVGACE